MFSRILINIILYFACSLGKGQAAGDERLGSSRFDERLFVRPLSNGKVYAYFEFKTFVPADLRRPYQANNDPGVDLFPSSLYRLFDRNAVQELSLSFSFGSWRWDEAGLPFRSTAPNAHLSVWFDPGHRNLDNIDNHFAHLTGELAGLFCSSLSTIDSTVIVRPAISYKPMLYNNPNVGNITGVLAALPKESVCKENIEPWLKLLPCEHKYGLARLLTGPRLFDSEYLSMSVDFGYSCSNILDCAATAGLELRQSVQKVFDTPLMLDGRLSWSLRHLFGSSLATQCPLATASDVYVDVTSLALLDANATKKVPKLRIEPDDYVSMRHNHVDKSVEFCFEANITQDESPTNNNNNNNQQLVYAHYDLKKRFPPVLETPRMEARKQPGNIGINYPQGWFKQSNTLNDDDHSIKVSRGHTITGVRTASLSIMITNQLDEEVEAIYLDMIPWYIRIYVHQIQVKARSLDDSSRGETLLAVKRLHYSPAQDRVRPHQVEMLFTLPARSFVIVEIECTNQYMLWTEFPPDSTQGLFINSASVTVFPTEQLFGFERHIPTLLADMATESTSFNFTDRLALYQKFKVLNFYTDSKQIPMATPDFSMPYNVICLVSTVLSIAFGPIFNLTNRRSRVPKRRRKNIKQNKEKEEEEEAAKKQD